MENGNTIKVDAALAWYLADAVEGDGPVKGGGHDTLLTLSKMLPAVVSGGACAGVYAWGPPGTGKTRTALAVAQGLVEPGIEVPVLACHPGLTTGDLWGYYLPTDTGARWVDGAVCAAWRAGLPLVLDELGRALGSEAESALLTACSGRGIARITLPTGETLHAPEGWTVLATGNTDAGDLPDPLRDRFIAVEVWGPSDAALRALTTGLCDHEAALLIRAVGSRYRPASNSEGFESGMSYRAATHYASLRAAGASVETAAKLALGATPLADEWVSALGLAQGSEGPF